MTADRTAGVVGDRAASEKPNPGMIAADGSGALVVQRLARGKNGPTCEQEISALADIACDIAGVCHRPRAVVPEVDAVAANDRCAGLVDHRAGRVDSDRVASNSGGVGGNRARVG